MFGSKGLFGGISKPKAITVQEQLSNIRESIASSRGTKGVAAAPSSQMSRPQNQQIVTGNLIEDSQRGQNRFDGSSNPSFASAVQPKNPNFMMGSHQFSDVGRDASVFSQATTAIIDTSTPGGDDSFRKQQRGSQGSGGNFSQDKFSFSGSDTIEIMDAVRSAQKDISLLKNMILTRFDCMDCAMTNLAASVSQLQQSSIASASKTSSQNTERARTFGSPKNFARCDPQSSDDLFRRDLSPGTRRSSRLASKTCSDFMIEMEESEADSDIESKIQQHQQNIKKSRGSGRHFTIGTGAGLKKK